MDLRRRVSADSDAGLRTKQVAEKYGVSRTWVRSLKQRRRETGSIAPRVPTPGIDTQFQYQAEKPPFDDPDKRRALLRRFNEIPGISLPDDAIDRRPTILLALFAPDEVLERFFSVIEWSLDEIRKV